MKVLLISANMLTEPYPVYPIGLDYVAAALAPRHAVRIADMNVVRDGQGLARIIQQDPPEVIGVSLRNVDNTDCTAPKTFMAEYQGLIRAVRNNSPAPVILGGSGFTIFPREYMDGLGADYGIIGEGERLAELLDAMENRQYPAGIPGVMVRGKVPDFPGPLQQAFDRGGQGGNAQLAFYLKHGGMLNLQTKRGCHFKCIYCTYPHVEGRTLRLIPPAEVAQTAVSLEAAGAKYIFVTDSAFNADIDHSLAVAKAFQKAGLTIPWGAFFAPIQLPDGYFNEMAAAGLTHVEFGTESLADRVLAAYQKPFRNKQVFQAHGAAVGAGLNVAHYFLLGGPGEEEASLEETLTQVHKLERTVLFFFCGMRIYPNTDLYDLAIREGRLTSASNIFAPVFYRGNTLPSGEILRRVRQAAENRPNWIVGAGGEGTAGILSKMYSRGFSGPLWEYLIR